MNWGLCCTDHARQEQEVSQRIELFKVADLVDSKHQTGTLTPHQNQSSWRSGMFHRRFCKQSFYGFRSEPVGRKSGHEITVISSRCVLSHTTILCWCAHELHLCSEYTIQYTYIIYHYHIATRVWVSYKLNIILNHFNLMAIQSIFSQMAACLTNAESILPFAANPLPNHAQPCRKDWAHVEGGWKESKQNWKVLKVHRESWRNIFIPLYSCIKSNQS